MKMRIKRFLQSLLVNDLSWLIMAPLVYTGRRLALSRLDYKKRKQNRENADICVNLFRERTVLHGLFKSLKYDDTESKGSSIYAKLLGSYEQEIMPVLEKLLKKQYNRLINIGCDEGYYAVGIAIVLPNIKVIAFDCSRKAQENCKTLSKLNNVQDRILVKGCFDLRESAPHEITERTIFIVDCEGCENEIITKQLVASFSNADFIIELHYSKHPLILTKLNELFTATHKISVIKALSDHERVMNYQFEELNGLTYDQKNLILNEREGFLEWFIAEAINE